MTRQAAPTEAEREVYLRDLSRVGPNKPIGYLPLYTIRDFAQLTLESVAAAAAARGLVTARFGPEACCIKSGALYVYNPSALAKILQTHAETLQASGLPIDPNHFISHIAKTWFQPDHPAYGIIAEAFGSST